MNIIGIVLLSVISGIIGRMGGAGKPYKSWIRDWLCPLQTILALWILTGIDIKHWWLYLIVYGLMGGALSTYWDSVFKFDNLWISGFAVGLTLLPLRVDFVLVITRAIVLAVIWGCLNKYLPKKVLLWRRDVVEEFLRYFVLPLTILIFLYR